MQRITGGWHAKLSGALDKGYAGMRVSGNAFWIEGNHWKQFCEYELELDHSLAGQRISGALTEEGPTVAASTPQTTDIMPASARSQRPCATDSRRAAASSSAPVTIAHTLVRRTNATAAIAGPTRTTPVTERLTAPSKISVCHSSPRRIARIPATSAMAPSAAT
jgi:DcmR-like sensory protein